VDPGLVTPARPSDLWLRVRAAIAIAAAIAVLAAVWELADLVSVLLVAPYLITGLGLVVRRPRQVIAWMLVLTAAGLALGSLHPTATVAELTAGTADPLGNFTAWASGGGWNLVFAGLVGIGFTFPTGTLPRGRWGAIARVVIVLYVALALANTFGAVISINMPGYVGTVDVPNPAALLPSSLPFTTDLYPFLFVLALVSFASFFARFRVATGVERLQYRWLAWALALAGVGTVAWALFVIALKVDVLVLANGLVLLSYPAVPISIVIAVLRYRLFDIDRLISRSLGWGIATAAVLAVFALAVLALQAALNGITQGQTIAVAASTLLAAAAFQPVRRRVQAAVDGRFDRPRLEAERSLAAYGDRLQQEVDIDALARDVEETVSRTLRPSAAALWIRGS
jgi:hypothetical protein